jgi:tetratricopeptide (TPR) repeat protein
MLWTDIPRTIPLDIHLRLQQESVARRPYDAARHAKLGEILLQLAKYCDAAAAFEQAEALGPRDFRHFGRLAECYLSLGRPDAALRVCERGTEVMPDCSDLHTERGTALRALGQQAGARAAFLRALALSSNAFNAAECLLLPLAADPDGARTLALCEEFPSSYANSTVVRGYRAIALSRVGRLDEGRRLVDLERYPARIKFEPPAEFGGIERFNALLADEILRNPGLRHTPNYRFYRTEYLAISGARVFPVLAKFLRAAIEDYLAEFARRGLDLILPTPPREGLVMSAGNVVRADESHGSHLHKFAYVSGVYHVSAPSEVIRASDRAGTLVLGSCDDFTGGYVPCWGSRDIKPAPGVATLFPSHIFHSVVSTHSNHPRIAVPFDLCVAQDTEDPRL